jgi:SAM-dependent methyltransferase
MIAFAGMAKEVASFFDQQADEYNSIVYSPGGHNAIAAERLHGGLRGDVLSVGGIWVAPQVGSIRVTVVDVSREMLRRNITLGMRGCRADARALPFGDCSFDHVVYPLVLHHIVGSNAWTARRFVRESLAEGARVLRPSGKLWIREFVAPSAVYGPEILAAPLTRTLLGLAGVPLVVMHSSAFFQRTLRALGLRDCVVEVLRAPEERPLDWIRPVIGLPWLGMPRFCYPVRPVLISAQR